MTWSTASETNNDYFTLERSCDENLFQFEPIKIIPGAGNSSTVKHYSYLDLDDTKGECYYRLSQTDYNGVTTPYTPVAINCNADAAFSLIGVVPNPADNEINVLFSTTNLESVFVYITDVAGQQLFIKNIIPEIGLNKIEIDVTHLASGVYFVKLDNGAKSFIKKIVKK